MLPRQLKADDFIRYQPQARKLVTSYLALFRQLPLIFLPNLLREASDYDLKFPAERQAVARELQTLTDLSPQQLQEWMRPFVQISLSSKLERVDWVNEPAQFVEQLSAYLWSTHQLDAFRAAALNYGNLMRTAAPPQLPPLQRLSITVVGQGVSSYDHPLFSRLRSQGAYFSGVNPQNGLQLLLDLVARRAKAHPLPYAHWYIDGGAAEDHSPTLTCVSYEGLAPVRESLLRRIQAETERPGMGPEALRTLLARLRPRDLGFSHTGDPVLDYFQLKVLTEGSGTQIFSTTFAQWAAREALRRAQPLTLLVRYAPRQRQRPMNELLSASHAPGELDVIGSLIDGDMGAYYNWINQQRLTGGDNSAFLVWFEGHNQALAVSPLLPRGTESTTPADLRQILAWML
ncbi:MAG TPA: hypothetical protein VFU27_16335 [Terriglobales bacterium]|nr:hypothetical protein [Terriglobales bacterium]